MALQFSGKTDVEQIPVGQEVLLTFFDDVTTEEIEAFLSSLSVVLSQNNLAVDTREPVVQFALLKTDGNPYFSYYDRRETYVVNDVDFIECAGASACTLERGQALLVKVSYFSDLSVLEQNNPAKLPIPTFLSVLQELKLTHPAKNLYAAITKMSDYSDILRREDDQKANLVTSYAQDLQFKLDALVLGKCNMQQFNTDFSQALHAKDSELQAHRKIWKPIVANITMALAGMSAALMLLSAVMAAAVIGIGVALFVLNAVIVARSGKALSVNSLLFFAKTNSERNNDAIEIAFQQAFVR